MIIAASILLFTLLCAALAGDHEWANVTKPERNDLVFQGRHRDYGAYVLRREYDRRVLIALFASLGLIAGGVFAVKLFVHGEVTDAHGHVVVIDRILDDIFPVDPPPSLPEQPAVTPPAGGPVVPAVGTVIMIDTAHFEADTASVAPPGPKADTLTAGPGGGGEPGPGTGGEPGGGGGPGFGGEPVLGMSLQEKPEFPGGEAAMYKWLGAHIRFPEDLQEEGRGDKVYVEFVIEKDGSISMATAVRGRTGNAKRESERVVMAMPNWSPGRMNGHPVRCRFVLPINFTVAR